MYDKLYPVTYYFYPLLKNTAISYTEQDMLINILNQEAPRNTEALLYIHIPYCHDLCRFCPFHVRADNNVEVYNAYTDALIQEMQMVAKTKRSQGFKYKAVYFGGGSPSIFPLKDIERIFDALEANFKFHPEVEISFEGEPKTLGNLDLLAMLKERNVSRVSFGLQTFDKTLREHFNINATLDDIDICTSNAQQIGFADINVDMMYDLPGQNVSMLENDIARLKDYNFDSIDYYNLHYYAFPQKFKTQMAKGEIPSKPSEDMHFALAEQLRFSMREQGYHYVADQVFAKTPQVSEYFRLLWGGGYGQSTAETVAIGSSARGYIDGYSYMNYGNVKKYLAAIANQTLPLEKVSAKLANPENRGAVFMLKFLSMHEKFNAALSSIPADILQKWQAYGLIANSRDGVFVTERGKNWTTNMMIDAFSNEQRELAEQSSAHLTEKPGIRTGSF